jgi:hypothetical protein
MGRFPPANPCSVGPDLSLRSRAVASLPFPWGASRDCGKTWELTGSVTIALPLPAVNEPVSSPTRRLWKGSTLGLSFVSSASVVF